MQRLKNWLAKTREIRLDREIEPRNLLALLITSSPSTHEEPPKRMDPDVIRFKEMVSVPWSNEVILKMIRKHGLDFSINAALDGRIPDVVEPLLDAVLTVEDASQPTTADAKMEESKEQNEETAPVVAEEPPVPVLETQQPTEELPRTPEPIDDDEDAGWVEELRRSVSKKVLKTPSHFADLDEDFPDSQPMDTDIEIIDADLAPDPVFSRRMTVLHDSDSEAPLSPTSEPKPNQQSTPNHKKRPAVTEIIDVTPPSAKRVALEHDLQTQALSQPLSALPAPQPSRSPVPARATPSPSILNNSGARRLSDDEKLFIKGLGLPPLLSDFPPHSFRRMQTLNVLADGAEGEQLGNLGLWNALYRNQCRTVNGREKTQIQRKAEVLMVVDMDFAYSKWGGPVMDMLEGPEFNVRVIAARLPCRNTIIFRRIGHDFELDRLSAVRSEAEGKQREVEEGYTFASQAPAPNEPVALPPLSAYTVDMDEMLVVLTPLQWSRPHFNNKQSAYLMDIRATHPGKNLSVLILHPKKLFVYPRLSTQDIGRFMPEMMFEYNLRIIYTEYGPDALQIATVLANMHQALANRAYDFASLDGPFRTFPHAGDSRTPARHPAEAYVSMLRASGVPLSIAEHVAKCYRSPLALYEALKACKDDETAMMHLKDELPPAEIGSLSKEHSIAIWKAFSPIASTTTPYKNTLTLP